MLKDKMTFTIDETFQIEGRGCVLAIKPQDYKCNDRLSVGDGVTIEKPNGETISTIITGVEHVKKFPGSPDIHPGILVGPEINKKDIPLKSLLYKKDK